MSLFEGLETFRVRSVPRRRDDERDPQRAQLFATLTAVHATDTGPLRLAWVRPPGQSLQILVGAPAGLLAADEVRAGSQERRILYPPGAAAEPVTHGDALLAGFDHWVVCGGRPDALWSPTQDHAREGDVSRGSFDDLVAGLAGPFAWLVLAEPRKDTALQDEIRDLDIGLPRMRQRVNSEADRVAVERAEGRYRELERAATGGMWDVRVLVGGRTEPAARTAAALLCSASELDGQPYAVLPTAGVHTLRAAVGGTVEHRGATAPFAATTELLSVLARPPARELPGLRAESPQCFDLTAESTSGCTLSLGRVLDASYVPGPSLEVAPETLNRHTFVCGATGSGKSQTVRGLLETVSRAGPEPVRWLVIEPAKAEYARMAGRLEGHSPVTVIRPGDLRSAPASLNPLEPEEGFPLQAHADLVRALFMAAFEAHEPFPQVLSTALTRVYEQHGWDLVSSEPRPSYRPRLHSDDPRIEVPRRFPTLSDLQSVARDVVGKVGYGAEVTADVRGFVDVRIGSLRQGAPGRFFEGGHPLDVGDLLQQDVVLEMEGITHDQDKAFLMGTVLIRIVEHLRLHRSAPGQPLRHLMVIEEAHRLLRNTTEGASAAAVEMFASLLAEIRAYGEGVVVVEQIPAKILPDVVKNTALKIVHRLPAEDDRRAVGGTMNLQPEQSELVVSLRPGTAAVAADGMDRPLLVEFDLGEKREGAGSCHMVPPIRGVRSPLCAADCAGRPCSLAALNDARHLAERPPVLLWVEALTAAHVTGLAPPAPSDVVGEALQGASERLLACALALAVERAVGARRTQLASYVHPADLENRLMDVVTGLLRDEPPDPGDRLRWTAGSYRWEDVRVVLRATREVDGPLSRPMPEEWARRGLRLHGDTGRQRWESFRNSPARLVATDDVVAGDIEVSGLRTAVTDTVGDWSDLHLAAALASVCRDGATDLAIALTAALRPGALPAPSPTEET